MKYFVFLLAGFLLGACGQTKPGKNRPGDYTSETLVIREISDHAYVHTSFMNVEGFGKVSCNGAIFFDKDEAVVLDTPGSILASDELIRWISDSLNCRIKAVVPTHFHDDCLAGLDAFHQKKIPSYAGNATIALARAKGVAVPQHGFDRLQELKVGDRDIYLEYMGEGHTRDNIVGYFPGEEIVFGGCLVKASGAGEGNLEDANTSAWPGTIKKLQEKHPDIKIVIPGHGDPGGGELLDYTIVLFGKKK
ncbi:subclass B1 metallo-beta-lactamase [Sinomicrobium weinanense]|uniref:beta-lactamase n=1 Tax=Sinomicrobium weinanense TaxID=2842200 RepID=A0A926JR63_9FLAO|nr:subclass B1 metallo-beta-lactamase [Sinomicrobium weinanense]MBC9795990.1 subclass B1 metallo-beta-lactamase [Sinomicrobium weinanense]MBU3122109.1 subclass B1 metallo-beta-lactamase [Sinomicrobium weinanense]